MRENSAEVFFKLATVAVVLSACGEAVEGGKAACDAVIRAVCQKAFACAPPAEFDTLEACIAKSADTQCPEADIREGEGACKAQGKRVDLRPLAHCEARYKEASCAEYAQDILCEFAVRCK